MNENSLLFKGVKVTFVFMVIGHWVTREGLWKGVGRDWQKQESRIDVKSLKTTAIMHFTGRVPVSIVYAAVQPIAPVYMYIADGRHVEI